MKISINDIKSSINLPLNDIFDIGMGQSVAKHKYKYDTDSICNIVDIKEILYMQQTFDLPNYNLKTDLLCNVYHRVDKISMMRKGDIVMSRVVSSNAKDVFIEYIDYVPDDNELYRYGQSLIILRPKDKYIDISKSIYFILNTDRWKEKFLMSLKQVSKHSNKSSQNIHIVKSFIGRQMVTIYSKETMKLIEKTFNDKIFEINKIKTELNEFANKLI